MIRKMDMADIIGMMEEYFKDIGCREKEMVQVE